MHFPPLAMNTLHSKFNCKHNIHIGQTSTDNQTNNKNSGRNNNDNNKNISIVVPYICGLGERLKMICIHMGIQVQFKGTITMKPSSWPPRTGTRNYKRVESFINLNAHISTTQKNIWGNPVELSGTGSRSI